MDLSPLRYHSHSVDLSRRSFLDFNENYFKSVFFDFAPLMAIPAYQDKPAYSMEEPENKNSNFTSYEHEALANAIGYEAFVHERSATEAILKTEMVSKKADTDRVRVHAYSFAAENRLDFVPTLGGDRRMHLVPVPWVEYIPVRRTSEMTVTTEENARRSAPLGSVFMHGLSAWPSGGR